MSSNKGKSRQRQLARAKYQRQLARRAASTRRRRQVLAGLCVLGLVVVGLGAAWFFGVFDSDKSNAKPDSDKKSSSSAPAEDNSGKSSDKDGGK